MNILPIHPHLNPLPLICKPIGSFYGVLWRLPDDVHGDVVRPFLHKYPPLGIGNPPRAVDVGLRPVVVGSGPEHGVAAGEVSADPSGRDLIGPAQGNKEVHELGTVPLFLLQGIEGATGVLKVPGVLHRIGDPAEAVFRRFFSC